MYKNGLRKWHFANKFSYFISFILLSKKDPIDCFDGNTGTNVNIQFKETFLKTFLFENLKIPYSNI